MWWVCCSLWLQAIFDVEVIAPAGLTVLSNSPPRGVHEVGGTGSCMCLSCAQRPPRAWGKGNSSRQPP